MEKHEKIFFSETIRPRLLRFGMLHHLVDLYKVCSNYTPRAKKGSAPGVTCLGFIFREHMQKDIV